MNVKEIFHGLTEIVLPMKRGGFESFINAWLIRDCSRGQTILVETGPASVVPGLVCDLDSLGCKYIDYLIYTHIHLDHSGGAGQFCLLHPETKVLAPVKGRPHLADPSRLVAGSRENIGDLCDLYGMPLPLDPSVLLADSSCISGLDAVDTPGHAPHHSSYLYRIGGESVLFVGEAAGCCFETSDGDLFMRPATPHKFFYDVALSSLNKLSELNDVTMICYPHSGCYRNVRELLDSARAQLELWRGVAVSLPENASPQDFVAAVMLRDPMMKLIDKLPASVRAREEFFLKQSAAGFLGARSQFESH